MDLLKLSPDLGVLRSNDSRYLDGKVPEMSVGSGQGIKIQMDMDYSNGLSP
jgi:hypothetical protein